MGGANPTLMNTPANDDAGTRATINVRSIRRKERESFITIASISFLPDPPRGSTIPEQVGAAQVVTNSGKAIFQIRAQSSENLPGGKRALQNCSPPVKTFGNHLRRRSKPISQSGYSHSNPFPAHKLPFAQFDFRRNMI